MEWDSMTEKTVAEAIGDMTSDVLRYSNGLRYAMAAFEAAKSQRIPDRYREHLVFLLTARAYAFADEDDAIQSAHLTVDAVEYILSGEDDHAWRQEVGRRLQEARKAGDPEAYQKAEEQLRFLP